MKHYIYTAGHNRQLPLFSEDAAPPTSKLNAPNGSGFHDPAFAGNKILPVHRWVPWIAGFSSVFVRDAINAYLKKKGTILDPFAGVGTTLVEATIQGHNSVGFEINPYAALACRAKVSAKAVNLGVFRRKIQNLENFMKVKSTSGYSPKSTAPAGFKTRGEFYSPIVLRKVLILQDYISTITDSRIRDLFRLAFASTMVSYSNYSYEPSLGQRKSSGKSNIEDFDVARTIADKLDAMYQDIDWTQSMEGHGKTQTKVINDSFFNYKRYLKANSIDLAITSPPYLNNYHYNRNTRPQLYWLNFADDPTDFNDLEHANFGKYWQTVREDACTRLEFSTPNKVIEKTLRKLRGMNLEKRVYGGNGWANYAASYFNDCYKFAKGLKYVLKPGGIALVVIGNSILQGIMIPTDQYFGLIAKSVGLELVNIDIPRATRIGNSIIQSNVRAGKAKNSHQLYESVVVLKKKGFN